MAALAFVAEILHGAPSRFFDPARFSFAPGGKDGHPFPVPLKVYDDTIRREAVNRARLGLPETLAAIRRLDAQARALELHANGPTFEAIIAHEHAISRDVGGRTVFGTSSPRQGSARADYTGSDCNYTRSGHEAIPQAAVRKSTTGNTQADGPTPPPRQLATEGSHR